jgi:hypothetical protein
MKNLASWLDNGRHKKSKFLNHRLNAGEEFIGIYKAANKAENNFGKTIHYILTGESAGEFGDWIFDNHNPKIAEIFGSIPPGSRVSVKKIIKNGKFFYDVNLINTLKDEEEVARLAKKSERAREGKREENKRDERLDENEG